MKVFKKTLLSLVLMVFPASANIPHSDSILKDDCYKQELNHQFKPENGEFNYSIMIYWDECDCKNIRCRSKKVLDWKLIKSPYYIPVFNFHTKKYEAIFYDSKCDQRVMRKVTSNEYEETSTYYDPEKIDTNTHEISKRKKLTQKHKNKYNTNIPEQSN